MVIDYILDRKDGYGYDVKEFYDACMAYEEFDIARALDSGTEKDVKKALCNYVIDNDYSKSICKYINSENWLEEFEESKKSARKSMKESINGDCYIYYDDDDGKRNVFCDYVKGITDTRDWFYLNEYIIDAIHIFKNEKQAQKFIDEHLKYFADQDKVVIAEYPQTVSGFFESKESSRKSIKESADDIITVKEFEERLSKGLKIIEDYFEEHWGSDIHLKYAKGIFDIWAVGEAKRYECINTKGTYFKQMSKNEKAKALEFNDLLEQEFKDYAKELVKEYQKKYPIEESKKSARKSIKENKMILSFEAFKDICVEEIGYSYIGSFDEYKGTYFVSVIDDKRADKFCKYLRDNYDCECTFWKITDPYDDDYGLYRVEVI